MCGIIGLVGQTKEDRWGESYRLLAALFLAAEVRGRDATGFVGLTDSLESPLRQSIVVAKAPLKASTFVETNAIWRRLRRQRCSVVLGHVRAATHGDPHELGNDPDETGGINNHPHWSDDLYLVHNGILPRYREIADRYSVTMRSNCDSEVLLRVIEKAPSPAEGMAACLREEPGAIGLFDARHKTLYLGRSAGRPLWFCRLRQDRRVLIASTAAIILSALKSALGDAAADRIEMLAPLAPYFVYALTADGSLMSVYGTEIRPAHSSTELWT